MNYKLILILTTLILSSLIQPKAVSADFKAAGGSATLVQPATVDGEDKRVAILRDYLTKYNSPLAPHAATFVKTADENDLDWRLVASIAGIESTFARHLPQDSYNAWGWGIYGDNMIRFNSYDEAIATISASLRTDYMNKWGAQDVYQIGKFYAASPTWAQRVTFFMNDVNKFSLSNPSYTLSLSI